MNIDFDRLKYSLTGEYEEVMLEKQLKEKEKEIDRLNNIIKEVREYIQDRYDGEVLTHTFDKDNVGELLEILKGSNNDGQNFIQQKI